MKISIYLAIFLSFLFSIQQAQAHRFKHVQSNPFESQIQKQVVLPWLEKIENHITKNDSKELIKELRKEKMSCSFSIKEDGSIKDLKILNHTSSENLSKSLTKYLSKISPFPLCESPIWNERGVILSFQNVPMVQSREMTEKVAKKFHLDCWFKSCIQYIERNFPSKLEKSVCLKFQMAKPLNYTNLKIVHSSGDKLSDEKAKQAIVKSSKFFQMPPVENPSSKVIFVTFSNSIEKNVVMNIE